MGTAQSQKFEKIRPHYEKSKKWILKVTNKDWIAKTLVCLLIWAIAFIPTYISAIIWWIISPETVGQYVITAIPCVAFGIIQIITGIVAAILTMVTILDDL